ncbi:type I toxin-antitoxin system Fst family toxin [Staphylococcus arlettae]|nr:type I toxin-antitoxin system Fst family toxin [Staphylococcus arlettae]
MDFLFVTVITPVITGCIVAWFTYWLNQHNK